MRLVLAALSLTLVALAAPAAAAPVSFACAFERTDAADETRKAVTRLDIDLVAQTVILSEPDANFNFGHGLWDYGTDPRTENAFAVVEYGGEYTGGGLRSGSPQSFRLDDSGKLTWVSMRLAGTFTTTWRCTLETVSPPSASTRS